MFIHFPAPKTTIFFTVSRPWPLHFTPCMLPALLQRVAHAPVVFCARLLGRTEAATEVLGNEQGCNVEFWPSKIEFWPSKMEFGDIKHGPSKDQKASFDLLKHVIYLKMKHGDLNVKHVDLTIKHLQLAIQRMTYEGSKHQTLGLKCLKCMF